MCAVWNKNIVTAAAQRVALVRDKWAKQCRANVGVALPKVQRANKNDGDQKILQKCKLFCEMGRGTYGRVLKVLYDGKVACLKRTHCERAKATFETEVTVLRHLDGRGGAPRVHEAAEDHTGFVMDCFHGDSLLDLVNKDIYEDALPYLHIFMEIAKSFSEIHAAGVVHRDFKEDNVIVRRDECTGRFVIHLIDFGMSWQVGKMFWYGAKYNPDKHYAPELYQIVPTTPQSDVYSLGFCIRDTFDYLVEEDCIDEWPGYKSLMAFGKKMMSFDEDDRPTMETVVRQFEQWIEQWNSSQ